MLKTKINHLLVRRNDSIKDAMQRLSNTAERILFVEDNKALIGTITDGDIRRALLKAIKFSDPVEKVMQTDFFYLKDDEANDDLFLHAKELMLEQKIEHLPILNEQNEIIDVILWTDFFSERKPKKTKSFFNWIVIMAGGKGTRLDPFTKILPKPLIPIGDKPIVENIMEKFYKNGFGNFMYILNYKKEYIKLFLREAGYPFNVEFVEEKKFLGTAGGLALLKGKFTDSFFVVNCDTILDANYEDILAWHKEHNALLTIVGCHKEVKVKFGVLEMDNGRLENISEKPVYDIVINTGIYVLEPSVLDLIPDCEFLDMNKLIDKIRKIGKISVYTVYKGWFDVGQWEEYKKSLDQFNKMGNL